MSAPRLTRPLVLEEAVRAPDGAGGFTESWTARGTLWAEVRAMAGRDRAGPGTALSAQGLRIITRAAPQDSAARPRPGQRLREGQRLYRIEAVTEHDTAGRYLRCAASEEVTL